MVDRCAVAVAKNVADDRSAVGHLWYEVGTVAVRGQTNGQFSISTGNCMVHSSGA